MELCKSNLPLNPFVEESPVEKIREVVVMGYFFELFSFFVEFEQHGPDRIFQRVHYNAIQDHQIRNESEHVTEKVEKAINVCVECERQLAENREDYG